MKRGIQALVLLGIAVASLSGCNLMERRHCQSCNGCNSPIGCRPCPIGWQRGGTDYGNHLRGGHFAGHHGFAGIGHHGLAGAGHHGFAGAGHHGFAKAGHQAYAGDSQVGSGVPAPAVAYPYYTVRGPRDFFVNNPPSIGR
jgi:hypothetical protein